MHPTFWKYFAAVSVCTCIFIVVAWLFWPYSSFGELKKIKNESELSSVVAKEKTEVQPQKEEVKQNPRLKIFAVGDIMLDRTMLLLAQKYNDFGYAFNLISSTLKEADLRVANLEGPITTNKSISNGNGGVRFSFTFSPKVVEPLHENFDMVSLANNHTTNFGFEGLAQTRQFLDKGSVRYFGDPVNEVGNISHIVEQNGIKIGFVGYHELVGTGFENVIAEVEKIRPSVDLIIAYPHWGTEYIMDKVNTSQKQEAHAMIDAGVDIIIGAHPHVIQPIEMYKEKLIFYSLGNFVFDQYFSLETMQGLLLDIDLEKDIENIQAKVKLIPIHINKQSQPFVAEMEEREMVLSALAHVSSGDEVFKESIRVGMLEAIFPLARMK